MAFHRVIQHCSMIYLLSTYFGSFTLSNVSSFGSFNFLAKVVYWDWVLGVALAWNSCPRSWCIQRALTGELVFPFSRRMLGVRVKQYWGDMLTSHGWWKLMPLAVSACSLQTYIPTPQGLKHALLLCRNTKPCSKCTTAQLSSQVWNLSIHVIAKCAWNKLSISRMKRSIQLFEHIMELPFSWQDLRCTLWSASAAHLLKISQDSESMFHVRIYHHVRIRTIRWYKIRFIPVYLQDFASFCRRFFQTQPLSAWDRLLAGVPHAGAPVKALQDSRHLVRVIDQHLLTCDFWPRSLGREWEWMR